MDEGERGVHNMVAANVAPTLAPMKSRWQKGSLTFGPAGRLFCSLIVLSPVLFVARVILAGGFFAVIAEGFGSVFIVTWCIWVVPRAMRDIWAAEVVYVPQPTVAPVKLQTDMYGKPVVSLQDYVAQQAESASDCGQGATAPQPGSP